MSLDSPNKEGHPGFKTPFYMPILQKCMMHANEFSDMSKAYLVKMTDHAILGFMHFLHLKYFKS